MHHPFIGKGVYYLRSPVCRMVVNNQYIKGKRAFLLEHRCYGIGYGRFTVKHRYDNRSLNREITGQKVCSVVFTRHEPGIYRLQVSGTHLFHLNLHVALRGVHIVELLFAAFACIILIYRVHIFRVVIYLSNALHCQAQLIEAGIGVFVKPQFKISFQCLNPEKHHRTKVKIITQAARLQVNCGCIGYIAVNLLAIMGISHYCISRHSICHRIEPLIINSHVILANEQKEIGLCSPGYLFKVSCRLQQATHCNSLYIIFCHFLKHLRENNKKGWMAAIN